MPFNSNSLRTWFGGVFNTILQILKSSGNLALCPSERAASIYPCQLCLPVSSIILLPAIHRHGVSADIYMAQFQGKKVAVKKFRIWETKKEDMTKHFIKEVNIMKGLGRHTNIVQLLGICHIDGTPSIVMPWMEQGSLYDVLQSKPPNMLRDQWVIEIAEGMLFLKNSALVHGDMKSANILINRDSTARIADFGLSRCVSSAALCSPFALKLAPFLSLFWSHIAEGCFLSEVGAGSSRWAAPENLHPEKWGRSFPQLTFESDIFALAMVFYEIYSSKIPFHDKNDYMAMVSIIEDRRPIRPQLMTDRLWELTTVCWHANASFRPSIEIVHGELTCTSRCPQEILGPSTRSNVGKTKE